MLMNTAGAAGSLSRFQQLLQQLAQHGRQLLLDVSPPDWPAVSRARRAKKITAEKVQKGQWAQLDCWLSRSTDMAWHEHVMNTHTHT